MISLEDALLGIEGRMHNLTRVEVKDFVGLGYEYIKEGIVLDSEQAREGLSQFLSDGENVRLKPKVLVLEFDRNYRFTLDLGKRSFVYGHVDGSDAELEIMAEYFKQSGFKLREA